MKITIDRIEGEYAVCELESGQIENIPANMFEGAKEGNIYEIRFLADETKKQSLKNKKLMDSLFED